MSTVVLHKDEKDRVFWIDEMNQSTDQMYVVCREVVANKLTHSTVRARHDLKPYLITDMVDGVVNTEPKA